MLALCRVPWGLVVKRIESGMQHSSCVACPPCRDWPDRSEWLESHVCTESTLSCVSLDWGSIGIFWWSYLVSRQYCLCSFSIIVTLSFTFGCSFIKAVDSGILDLYGSECGEGTYFVFVAGASEWLNMIASLTVLKGSGLHFLWWSQAPKPRIHFWRIPKYIAAYCIFVVSGQDKLCGYIVDSW